jgi:hypothetical protein
MRQEIEQKAREREPNVPEEEEEVREQRPRAPGEMAAFVDDPATALVRRSRRA